MSENEKHDYLRGKVEEFLKTNNTQGLLYESPKKEALTMIDENENEFVITVKLPGLTKEDIHIMSTKNGLLITAEKKLEFHEKNEISYIGKQYAQFSQYITLPEEADKKNTKARYAEGYLVLFIPKVNSDNIQ